MSGKRCLRCGGKLSDSNRDTHESCESKALPRNLKIAKRPLGMLPHQWAQFEQMAEAREMSRSELLRTWVKANYAKFREGKK